MSGFPFLFRVRLDYFALLGLLASFRPFALALLGTPLGELESKDLQIKVIIGFLLCSMVQCKSLAASSRRRL